MCDKVVRHCDLNTGAMCYEVRFLGAGVRHSEIRELRELRLS